MEIKTLKDIRNELTIQDDEDSFVEYLRQEAIKWIKELKTYELSPKIKSPKNRNIIFVNDKYCFDDKNFIQARDLLVDWIKHFFNINEEDLENEN